MGNQQSAEASQASESSGEKEKETDVDEPLDMSTIEVTIGQIERPVSAAARFRVVNPDTPKGHPSTHTSPAVSGSRTTRSHVATEDQSNEVREDSGRPTNSTGQPSRNRKARRTGPGQKIKIQSFGTSKPSSAGSRKSPGEQQRHLSGTPSRSHSINSDDANLPSSEDMAHSVTDVMNRGRGVDPEDLGVYASDSDREQDVRTGDLSRKEGTSVRSSTTDSRSGSHATSLAKGRRTVPEPRNMPIDGVSLLREAGAAAPVESLEAGDARRVSHSPGLLNQNTLLEKRSKGQYTCPYSRAIQCEDAFSTAAQASAHAQKHPQCDVCGRMLLGCDELRDHEKTQHGVEDVNEAEVDQGRKRRATPTVVVGKIPCPRAESHDCGITFATWESAAKHAKSHLPDGEVTLQSETGPSKSAAAATNQPIPEKLDNGRWNCPYAESHGCTRDFADPRSARRHGNVHVSSILCPVCAKKFARLDILKQHMRSKHSKAEIKSAEAVGTNNAEAQVDDPSIGFDDDRTEVENDTTANEPTHADMETDTVMETVPVEDLDQASLEDDDIGEPAGDAEPALQEWVERNFEETESQEHEHPAAVSDHSIVSDSGSPERSKTKLHRKRKREAHESPGNGLTSTSRKRQKTDLKVQPAFPASRPNQRYRKNDTEARAKAKDEGTLQKEATDRPVSRQGSMDGWAQPYHEGSKLRHPLFNPESPETARKKSKFLGVFVPSGKKSHGKPEISGSAIAQDEEDGDDDGEHVETPMPAKKRKTYPKTSRNRKNTSEEMRDPGIATSDPTKIPKTRQKAPKVEDEPKGEAENTDSTSSDSAGEGLATSIAKRTFDRPSEDSDEYEAPSEPSDQHPLPADEHQLDPEQHDDFPRPAKNRRRSRNKRIKHQSPADDRKPVRKKRDSTSIPTNTEAAAATEFYCHTCNRQFETRIAFRKHRKNPSVHQNLLQCEVCLEEFWNAAVLDKHHKDTRHTIERRPKPVTGKFSKGEELEVEDWRKHFCREYDLTLEDFCELMMAARSKLASNWTCKLISKEDFVQEYLNVLEYRDRQSMIRFSERKYSNVDRSEWTEEDDDDIVRLVHEHGTVWTKIGQKLGRSAEGCRQRWKNKLSLRTSMAKGEWTNAEEQLYERAVEEVRRASVGPASSIFTWSAVSAKIKTRTPQQCANHWRAKHGKKVGDRWIASGMAETSPLKSVPSRMEERLAGRPSSSYGKSLLSETYVKESDDEDDNHDQTHTEDQMEVPANFSSPTKIRDSASSSSASIEDQMEVPESPASIHHAEDVKPSNVAADDSESSSDEADDDAGSSEANGQSTPSHSKDRLHADPSDENKENASRDQGHHPLTGKTPSRPMTTSQVFRNTQANTSATRQPLSVQRLRNDASQDRPSPEIPLERRTSTLHDLDEADEDDMEESDSDVDSELAVIEDEAEEVSDDSQGESAEDVSSSESSSTDSDSESSPESGSASESESDNQVPSASVTKTTPMALTPAAKPTTEHQSFWGSIKAAVNHRPPVMKKKMIHPDDGDDSSDSDTGERGPKLPKLKR